MSAEILDDPATSPHVCAICGHDFEDGDSMRGVIQRNCPTCGAQFTQGEGWLGSEAGPEGSDLDAAELSDGLEMAMAAGKVALWRALDEFEEDLAVVPDKMIFVNIKPRADGKALLQLAVPVEMVKRLKGPWHGRDRFLLVHIPNQTWHQLKRRKEPEVLAPPLLLDAHGKPLMEN